MEQLHCIDTNAAGDESAGEVFGLPFQLLILGCSGVVVSLLIIAALVARSRVTLLTLSLAVIPALLTVSLAIFRTCHPPGYDLDLLDLWLHGPSFAPSPPPQNELS